MILESGACLEMAFVASVIDIPRKKLICLWRQCWNGCNYLLHRCSNSRWNAFRARWPEKLMRNVLSYKPDRFFWSRSRYGSISDVKITFWLIRRHIGHSFCLHSTRIPKVEIGEVIITNCGRLVMVVSHYLLNIHSKRDDHILQSRKCRQSWNKPHTSYRFH